MKFAIGAVVAAAGLIVASPTASARGPYGSINVGNWKGGAYTNDKCGWILGFAHEKWTLTTGRAFPIALTFDGQTPFNVHGVPLADKLLQVPMPTNSSLIAQFRKAKAMTAYTQGQLFQFKLDQTAQLLPTLANCDKAGPRGIEMAIAVPAEWCSPNHASS